MRHLLSFLVILILFIPGAGCASKKGNFVLFENIQVRFQSLDHDGSPNVFLINSQVELEKVMSELQLTPGKGMPNLAMFLEERSLILVYGGRRPTSGHRLHVVKVVEDKKGLTIRTRLLKPGPNCYENTVITFPMQVIAIPKTKGTRLTLDLLESLQDCN